MTYDNSQAAYKNEHDYNAESIKKSLHTPPRLVQQADPPSRGSQRRNSAYAHQQSRQSEKLNNTISYDDPQNDVLPQMNKRSLPQSPNLTNSYKKLRPDNRLYESVDHHHPGQGKAFAKLLDSQLQKNAHEILRSSHQNLPSSKFSEMTSLQDVQRQSLEQDRYYSRLDQMNSKQQQIFEKYLVDQLVPTKDKEKQLEEIERKKRDEARMRLDALDQGSRLNQKALKKEYQKFLNNQMKQKEREHEMQSQAKRDALSQMKTFAFMEQEKDKQEKMHRMQMQTAYRNALQSQEYLKAKQKLHTEIKLHSATSHGGTADALYTFGGSYVSNGAGKNKEKGYIPPNPIVSPISDPMYNPYLRKDISEGIHEFRR